MLRVWFSGSEDAIGRYECPAKQRFWIPWTAFVRPEMWRMGFCHAFFPDPDSIFSLLKASRRVFRVGFIEAGWPF